MIYLHEIALSSGDTWDANLYKLATITATGNVTLTAEMDMPGIAALIFTQDATGSRTLTVNGTAVDVATTGTTIIDVVRHSGGWSFRGTASASGGDTTRPSVTFEAISGTTIRATFNEEMFQVTVDGFTFHNGATLTPSAVTPVGGNVYDFTVSGLTGAQTITADYDAALGATQDAAGNELATFTAKAVTNSVPSSGLPTGTLWHSEGFEGLSGQAMPAGWLHTASETTTNPAYAYAGSRGLVVMGPSIGVETALYDTADANSGNVLLRVMAKGIPTTKNYNFLVGRASSGNFTTMQGYALRMVTGQASGNTVTLMKNDGSGFAPISAEIGTLAAQTWYELVLILNGSTIQGAVRRPSDNMWMQTDGSWAADETACLTYSDTVAPITGAGKHGCSSWTDIFVDGYENAFDDFKIYAL